MSARHSVKDSDGPGTVYVARARLRFFWTAGINSGSASLAGTIGQIRAEALGGNHQSDGGDADERVTVTEARDRASLHSNSGASRRACGALIRPLVRHTGPSATIGIPSHRRDRERGALSLVIVILFAVLLTLTGIVVDGAAKLTADEDAVALAQEAARAGTTQVDPSRAYASGSFVIDQGQALAAARQYLIGVGCDQFRIEALGTKTVRVSVTITEPTKFLSLIGVGSFTSTGSATATLVTSVTGGT